MFRLSLLVLLAACHVRGTADAHQPGPALDVPAAAAPVAKNQAEAIFAAGCFWCSEKDFEKVDGVIEVESGYAGGQTVAPTYRTVGSGTTGHTEAIRVIYDPKKVTYEALLDYFWHHVDAFDAGGQFCDRGSQYRPAILPVNDAQREAAKRSVAAIELTFERPVALALEEPGTFWVAETYHQDFYKKSPDRYNSYRSACGRDAKIAKIWSQVEELGAH
jgi:peptide-methionine (S)-S-oxide reductase